MSMQHQNLASGRWQELSFLEQMANIGSEVERTIKWKNKNNQTYANLAFDRVLELLDLTLNDVKNKTRLKEIARSREAMSDYFVFDNIYQSTDQQWQKYFNAFNYAVAIKRS